MQAKLIVRFTQKNLKKRKKEGRNKRKESYKSIITTRMWNR